MNRSGKLLVAHPNLPRGHYFKKSIIYVYSDSEQEGTLGLMLNIKSTLKINELFQSKNVSYPDSQSMVRLGGPVNTSAVIMFHTDDWASTNTADAHKNYHITSDVDMFRRISMQDEPRKWRIVMGTCSWGPGQLDLEMNGELPYQPESAWLVADPDESIVFDTDDEDQWARAIEISKTQLIDEYI